MKEKLLPYVEKHGTPLFILDHKKIRENYHLFTSHLKRVQAYYAVKSNSNEEIVKTLFHENASFDVASYNEFMLVHKYINHFEEKSKDHFIWDKIIFSNTIKDPETLKKIKRYKPLVTFDNITEVKKVKEYCNTAGMVLRLKVPDIGSQVEMSSKFGAEPSDAMKLIDAVFEAGLVAEGVSFHVGSQCTNLDNYRAALALCSEILNESRKKGYPMNIVDMGGGFPAPYDDQVPQFEKIANVINTECDRLFPKDVELIAEPGRFISATSGTLITEVIGKTRRDGKVYYHINDGVYHTFSGVVFDHWVPNFTAFKHGKKEVCAVVGQTCDSFDKITLGVELPGDLDIGDRLYTTNIGSYSVASSTKFNGFEGAKIIHINTTKE